MSTNPYYGQEGHGPYELIGIGNLELEEGGNIPDCQLAVATHGMLNAARDNAILVPTWYSGTSKIMEQVYIGNGRALDPAKYLSSSSTRSEMAFPPHRTTAVARRPDRLSRKCALATTFAPSTSF
jgi:Homoserine acetyltransferase